MRAATLFSGIGAPEVAMPDWDWIWHAERDAFPSAVMAARHSSSVNLGDVTADDFCDRARAIGCPDVLVFGSPCQSFSVAGRRLGLDDPSGNLALVALGIVAELEPSWFVFENVPGLLSSTDGRDFGLFLRAVDDLRYHLCWTVLDAQHFGVAQRRRRVFAVGHARDWRGPAAVLLEPDRLCGDPPARGEAREDVTGTRASRPSAGGGLGTDFDLSGGLIARCLSSSNQRIDWETETLITHALDSFSAGRATEDGTGRGTPLVAVFDPSQITSKANRSRPHPELSHTLPSEGYAPVAFSVKDDGGDVGEIAPTLRSGNHDQSHASGGVMPAVAFNWQAGGSKGWLSPGERTSALSRGQTPAVSVSIRGRDGGGTAEISGEIATAIRASQGGGDKPHVLTSAVRRLMPTECEALQGFERGYTAITYRNKPAADGPRYKAIGNSMAVPVVRWILQRLASVESLRRTR